jgi:hypothetical protein
MDPRFACSDCGKDLVCRCKCNWSDEELSQLDWEDFEEEPCPDCEGMVVGPLYWPKAVAAARAAAGRSTERKRKAAKLN